MTAVLDETVAAAGTGAAVDPKAYPFRRALVFDTETTGLLDFTKPADDPAQPRMAGISACLIDPADWQEQSLLDSLVRPEGWTFDDDSEAAKINGLTAERLGAEGRPIAEILDAWSTLFDQCDCLISYSLTFDAKIIRGEQRRLGLPDRYAEKPVFDLLKTARTVLKGRLAKGERCTLTNAHKHLTGEPFKDAHTSLADMRAAVRILRHFTEKNLVVPQQQFQRANEGQ